MDFPNTTQQQFIAVSAALTGHDRLRLVATGMGDAYWQQLVSVVGINLAGDLLSTCAALFEKSRTPEELEALLKKQVMASKQHGPLARNIIVMWYMGQWNSLPREWCDEFGGNVQDSSHVISPQAFVEGLVWPTFGAHPRAGKPTGFGSWTEPPINAPNTDLSPA